MRHHRLALLGAGTLAGAVTTAAALAFLPAAAGAQVVVGQGIGGARLESTSAQVHAALGAPLRARHGVNAWGSFTQETYPGGLVVVYEGGGVTSVWTTGLGDRTARGIGVGSTEAAVRRGVRGIACQTIWATTHCHTGSFRVGERMTDFALRDARVVSVSVGTVLG